MNEPVHIISLGAGVQSSTMALMASRGEITPMPTAAIFADTQHEPSDVYEWLGWLSPKLKFPVINVTYGNLTELALRVRTSKKTGMTYLKHNIPTYMLRANGKRGIMQRHCTKDFKIDILRRQAKKIAGKNPIVMWIGISTDEADRMKDSNDAKIVNRYPLIESSISRNDCINWMRISGYPKPPRSACEFCPYHSDDEWIRLKTEQPESFSRAVQFEQDYQAAVLKVPRLDGRPFLHNSLKPLNEVDFIPGKQPWQFKNECEGMCGV